MKASILTSAAIFHLRLRRYQVRRQRHKENLIFFTAPTVLAIKLPCVSRFLTKHVIDASLSLFVLHLLDRSFCISCHPLPTLLPTLPCCCKSCAFLTTSSRCVHLSANQNNPNLFVRSTPTRYACRHHRRHFYFPTPLRPSSLAMTPPSLPPSPQITYANRSALLFPCSAYCLCPWSFALCPSLSAASHDASSPSTFPFTSRLILCPHTACSSFSSVPSFLLFFLFAC
jgi:hypothetical protein